MSSRLIPRPKMCQGEKWAAAFNQGTCSPWALSIKRSGDDPITSHSPSLPAPPPHWLHPEPRGTGTCRGDPPGQRVQEPVEVIPPGQRMQEPVEVIHPGQTPSTQKDLMQQKVETEGQTEEISPWLSTDFQKEELELGVRSKE